MCNSNCGGRHAHRTLSPNKQGILSAWKSRFYAETHPVAEISTPPWTTVGGSVRNTTISTRSRRSQSSGGTRSRDTRLWQTTPPAATEKREDNRETIKSQGGHHQLKRQMPPERCVSLNHFKTIECISTCPKRVSGIATRDITYNPNNL